MSVVIKGMQMPETCAECPCLRHDSLDGEHAYQCNVTLEIRKNIDKKPEWCPLVALPEKHGKLIDADAFFSRLEPEDLEFSFHVKGAFVNVTIINDILRNQPPVIEAEGE